MPTKAINKVVYGNSTLIDLTNDTATASDLAYGVTAHDKTGARITGTLTFQTIYSGSSAPSSSLGEDGDIYIQI